MISKKTVPAADSKSVTLLLPAALVQRLDELRKELDYKSTTQVAWEAIEWYLRVRRVPLAQALAGLTPRLREVLQFIGEGLSTKQIAAQLDISVKTVEMHRTHLMKALNIRGVAGLVRFAIRTGLVRLDD
jgi:DNA-binding NarL/FixJ family response regulator